ncbi:MAG: hypothetical protein CMF72_01600 [Mameliella sp.]|jgi:hypothetical protein|nr:hypothetical protein [Mameliella sp.]|tara:strand:+ start:6408 stop:7460 length:1053 start_codon:yes stop_codon:yes gene_type:complete
MTFSEAVTSVTRSYIVPKCYDTVSNGSPVLMKLLQNAKPWKSGVSYDVIVKYQDSTNGGNTGIADKLDTDRQNVRTTMTFRPKMAYKPVVIANIEQTLNQGDEQVIDLLEAEFDSQAQSLMQVMATNLWTGTGSGNSWDSIYNAADDGTNFGTYGTLSRTTYTTLKGYYLASAGALTLAKMATAYDSVSIGNDSPDIIATTKTLWSTYESLLQPTVRAGYTQNGYPKMNAFGMVPTTAAMAGQAGFDVLFFRGTPVVKDEQIPSGKMFLINTNYFGFKGINISGLKQVNFKKSNDGVPLGVPGRIPSTRGFNFRDMMSPVDQLAEIGHLVYAGNFISENPRLQGQMVGLT